MSNIDKKHIIKHFRTSTSGHVVSPDNIEIGEIAMNYNSESPMLMFKDNEGNIQKVGSVLNVTGSSEYHTMSQKSITEAINDKFDSIEIPEVALSETYEEVNYPTVSDEDIVFKSSLKGDSLDIAVNKLDSNISLLVSETLKNETVVAAAFTEIKENVGLDENLKYVSDDSANFISGATTFAEADSLLDAAIEEVRSSVPSLDNYYNKTEVNELIDEITTGDIQLANYYTKNEVDGLIPSVPTSNTAFTNDAGYITLSEVPKTDLSEYAKKSELEGLASETYVNDQISNLVSGAPSVLDTLDELAKALNDDANFATTVTNQIAEKADKDHTHTFESITDKPTTLGGYGIVDAKIEGKTITLGENSLDVSEAVLSESYEEVVYPTVKNENIVFESSQSGDSLDTAVNKLDSNISLLVSEVLKDEKVMAKSITDIKENVGLDKNLKYVPNENAKYISNATTFAEADMLLDEALQNFSSSYVLNLGDIIIEGGEGLDYSNNLYANLYGTIDSEINEKIYSTITNNGSILINDGNKVYNIDYYELYTEDEYYEYTFSFYIEEDKLQLKVGADSNNNVWVEQYSLNEKCIFNIEDIDFSYQDGNVLEGTLNYMYKYDEIYTVYNNFGIIELYSNGTFYHMYTRNEIFNYGDNLIFAINNFEGNYISYFEICFDGTVYVYIENIFNVNITDEYTDRVDEFIELYNETNVSFTAIESGMNLDTVADSLESNFLLLVNEIKKNETVVAKSIIEIKENVGLNENLKYVSDENAEYISGATTFAEADSLLDAAIRNMSNGGYIFIEKFDKNDFQNALTLALESLEEGESAILDCTYFKGKHTITEGFIINNPVSLIFGGIDVEFNNSVGANLFTFNSNNISIQGINRNTDKTQTDNGATVFRMLNADNSLEGYHIKSRGNKNLEIKNITLVGLRTTMGHQYGNSSYDIDGVGGIYIEKAKPEIVEGGNTCNNVRIENVLIAGSKAHGIYLDTPILSSIKNVRLSDCGGHGIFINGGTSILFENTYVSSSDMAGFCIYGSSYVSLNNCVSENGGIGFWIRSSFNVTMTSPGVEATKNHGANPWRYSQPITNKFGLNLSTLSSDGSTSISIPDVNSDASSYFRGYGILISGGKSINVFTPYIKSISQQATNAGYPNGAENTSNVKYINVIGDARSVYISNPSFKEMDNSTIPSLIKHEIGIEEDVINLELVYNTEQTTLKGTLDDLYYVTDNSKRAPIYCKSTSTLLRNGKKLITNYHYSTLPTESSELTNKEYVDSLVKNLDVEHKLSETYESVTYPTVEETDGIEFVAAKANDDLDTVVFNLDRNVSTLIQEVLKDEIAVAQMISNHNESCGFNGSGQYVKYTEGSVINKSKNTSEALIALDNAISNMNVVLSDNYKSVIYPEDCGDKTFTPAVKGQNLDEAIKTVETNIATLVQTVIENEEIGVRSLVKHNTSCGFDVNGNYVPFENGTIIGNSTNISDALIALDVSYSNILESVPSIEDVNNLINNLDIEHKLSETYESVTYPTVEETSGIEFVAAKANDNLDTVVFNLDRNVSTLIQEVLKDEEVTAAAITEIKESVGLDENLKYVVNTSATYISGATSLSEADNLLDAAIKNVISEIPSLDDYATKEYVTSQLGNVDLSEINEQLEEANNKISLLETQLSAATSTISTLESKLDAIIRAVGLNSDGTFIVPTTAQTSGYTTAATSVMSAIHLMDNQIEENETVSAYALTDLNNRLNEESSRIDDIEESIK